MSTASALLVPVELTDGTRGVIRAVRPEDRDLFLTGYDLLSEESRYHRFLSPMPELTDPMLDQLIDEVDFVDHVAIGLVLGDPTDPQPGGVARVVRLTDEPDSADIAVTVVDPWQGKGAAGILLTELMQHRPVGVERLKTLVAAGNEASLAMLRNLGDMTESTPDQGAIEVEIVLPPAN